ncbi:MAG: hypothetical protein IJ892_07610 [Prevotella sp.]|nr:hypothetical protein [Prevotella sp.]
MRYTLYIYIGLLTLVLGLGACSSEEDLVPIEESSTGVPAGDVRIMFRTNLPTAATTRAGMLDSEADPAVTSLQMLCFDSYGTYVGRRTATALESNGTTPDNGTFTGTVPDVTAHIHFIGNLSLSFPSSSIGKHENVLMHSLETSTLYSSAPTMVYWGYVRKDNAAEMQAWLNPTDENEAHTVYMIHDRAQVQLATKTTGGTTTVDFHDDNIQSIDQWIISNGRERGYIAPFNQSTAPADPFSIYYTESGGTRTATPVFTEYEGARYTATEDKLANATDPLFLYEDINHLGEGATNTVKVILKITYKTGGTITNANKVRYQVVLLQDKDKNQLRITRNHRYVIHLDRMPYELGYENLADAAAATSFTNGQMVSVAEAVSNITNGEIAMQMNDGKTSVIYQQASDANSTKLIPFSFANMDGSGAPYTLDDDGNATTTKVSASDFTVVCDHNTGALSTNTADLKINDYDPTTGIGHISMKTGSISTSLQNAKVTITDKNYGMSRVLNVYTITKFNLSATLQRVEGAQRTGISGSYSCPTYKLSLTLPGNYPEGLYPITVKFATSTLNAFSDETAGQAHGSFGISVESTAGLSSSNTATAWNYKASDWGYWYTYEIPAKPNGVDDQNSLLLDIYLDDVRGLRGANNRANQVGLFLQIQYFGDITTYTAN